MAWLTPDEILRVPSEQLGVLVLHRLSEVKSNQLHLANFTNECLLELAPSTPLVATVHHSDDLRHQHQDLVAKISDAWSWLEHERFIGPDPNQRPGSGWMAITSRGKDVLQEPVDEALTKIRAGHLLGDELHPRVERQARGHWNAGDFATAIFNTAREVEIAVGESLPPQPKKRYGVDVINAAFGKEKPLSDPDQDPGEQEGTRALYAGFIATFKNPGSHRHYEPDDPVQAADIIRTADLLMRMLDDRLAEIQAEPEGVPDP